MLAMQALSKDQSRFIHSSMYKGSGLPFMSIKERYLQAASAEDCRYTDLPTHGHL